MDIAYLKISPLWHRGCWIWRSWCQVFEETGDLTLGRLSMSRIKSIESDLCRSVYTRKLCYRKDDRAMRVI